MKDTIYRQDAIDGVKTLHDVAWKNWHEPTLSANVVLDMIGELPPAQPERKTGKWLTSDDFYETGICSRCKWDSQEPISYAVTNFNFCPNCGARMVQEGEDNDS